jgi:hypothetical protein
MVGWVELRAGLQIQFMEIFTIRMNLVAEEGQAQQV